MNSVLNISGYIELSWVSIKENAVTVFNCCSAMGINQGPSRYLFYLFIFNLYYETQRNIVGNKFVHKAKNILTVFVINSMITKQ